MSTTKHFQKGEVIFKEGVHERFMYKIVSGSVDIISEYETENAKVLTTVKDGGIFGELAVIDFCRRSASAVAGEETEAVMIGAEDLEELSKKDPMLLYDILRSVCDRIRDLSKEYEEACNDITDYYNSEIKKAPASLIDRIRKLASKAGKTVL